MRELRNAPLSTVLLERDCLGFGLSTFRISGQAFIASDSHGSQLGFNKAGTVLNSRPAAPLARDKHSTRLILQSRGVPAPRGRLFDRDDTDAATAYAETLGYPVVLKPLRGSKGEGVVTGIASPEELEWAFRDIADSASAEDGLLVEEHIEGEAYRIIVVGDKAVSALISRRGKITGDGRRTPRQLVKDRQKIRELNPHLMSRPITLDARMEHLLDRQQAQADRILTAGRAVEFTYGSNTQLGGEHSQVLDELHPSIAETSISAVQALPGLGFAGVDFLIPDIRRPVAEQRAAICEINTLPAVDSHEYPLYGGPVSVARKMVAASAEQQGVHLQSYSDEVALSVTIVASEVSRRYRHWLRRKARSMRLRCRIRAQGRTGLTASLRGNVQHAAIWLGLVHHNPHRTVVHSLAVHHD